MSSEWVPVENQRPENGRVVGLLCSRPDGTIERAIGWWNVKEWVITAAPRESVSTIFCWCRLPENTPSVISGDLI
ncbi:MAG: hypothetical protein JWO20_2331 [Candidatus Angelobacter sp.]|nr:hypothetical protein [Candidatus Angelobacter sp.]